MNNLKSNRFRRLGFSATGASSFSNSCFASHVISAVSPSFAFFQTILRTLFRFSARTFFSDSPNRRRSVATEIPSSAARSASRAPSSRYVRNSFSSSCRFPPAFAAVRSDLPDSEILRKPGRVGPTYLNPAVSLEKLLVRDIPAIDLLAPLPARLGPRTIRHSALRARCRIIAGWLVTLVYGRPVAANSDATNSASVCPIASP
jgi:hypothetical protein